MPNPLKEKRNKAIQEHYNQLADKKKHGVQLYTHAAILKMVQEKFFVSERTITRALWGK